MSLADVQGIITNAQKVANDATADARNYSSLAQTAAATITNPGSSGSVIWSKPTVFNAVTGAVDLGTLFNQEANNDFNALGPDYIAKFTGYLGTYFPSVGACLATNTDNWICNMILNGGNGLPDAIVNMIWQRAREEIAKDIAARRDNAYSEMSSRGFTSPPGALNYQLMQLDQEAISKNSSVARDTAVKNIEIQIENVRFAVGKAIEIRMEAAKLAIEYVRTYIKAYDSATERARAMVQARFWFFGAINAYYDAFSRIEALDVEVRKTNVEGFRFDNKLFVEAAYDSTKTKVEAALSAAQALGAMAAAAIGAQNSLAYIGNTSTS
jgi:hypothetical protein